MKKLLFFLSYSTITLWAQAQQGELDTSFNRLNILDYNSANSLIIQPDKKILVGGAFSQKILRLNTDGTPDPTFVPLGNSFNSWIPAMALQTDGKIVVGGGFTEFNNAYIAGRIARLNSDASIDTTFRIGTGITTDYSAVQDIVIQPDGKIVVGGDFDRFNNTDQYRIMRLNSDGTIDPTFKTGAGFNREISTLALQPDGKILAGGIFWSYKGQDVSPRMIRLNSDGSVDNTFTLGDGFNGWVQSIALQPDGKIVVGGMFTMVDQAQKKGIVRLNADGTIDPSFNVGSGFDANPFVHSVFVLPNGKILVGGQFTLYNGTNSNRIIRLNSDGSVDATFTIGDGCDQTVHAFALQDDERIIIAGEFNNYNNVSRKFVARLYGDNNIRTNVEDLINFCESPDVAVPFAANGFFNSGNTFTAQLSDENGDFSKPTNIGSLAGTSSGTINATIPSSVLTGEGYRIRVVSSNPPVDGYNNGKDLAIHNIIPVIIRISGFKLETSIAYKTYQWYRDENEIEGADKQSYTVTENGKYKVVVTDDRGCTDTSDFYNVTNVPTGIQDKEYQALIRVYPNPSSATVHIESPEPLRITLTNLQGQVMLSETGAKDLSLNRLAPGVYMLRIMNEQGMLLKVERLVKK